MCFQVSPRRLHSVCHPTRTMKTETWGHVTLTEARRLRIGAELLQLFDELDPQTKKQLASRIHRDVADNGLDTSWFYVEEEGLDTQL